MADAVEEAIDRRSELLERREILEKSVPGSCAIVLVEDIGTAIDFVNELAPEHLELCSPARSNGQRRLTHAGAIFLGNYKPKPLGDYFAGPNHTLPTSGTARFFSPLNTGDFQKKISILRYTEESLKTAAADVVRFAEAEGLTGHAAAVKVRFEE
jgi:histidinol dehydrogenase